MESFRHWLESQKVTDYLGGLNDADRVEHWLLSQPPVRAFLAKIDQANLVRPVVGKKGYLVMSKGLRSDPFTGHQYYDSHTGNTYQHRIPVNFARIDGNEAELERMDGKDFSEIAYKAPHFPDPKTKRTIVVPLDRITVVKNDQTQQYTRWLTMALSKGAREAGVSIPKYFRLNWDRIQAGLEASVASSQIQSKFRTTELGFNYFANQLPDVPKTHRGGKGAQGRVIEQFPNGYRWISLDKVSCEEEGNAGGHCGNAGNPLPGDNVLSFRDKDGRVYLTFVINNGELSERKANGNRKPPRDLHPYIVALLKNPMVKKIGPGKYLGENDFQLSDLDPYLLAELGKARPDLINVSKIDLMFMKNPGKEAAVIKRLEERYPFLDRLGVSGYDKQDRALRFGHGKPVNDRYYDDWRRTATQMAGPVDDGYDIPQLFIDYYDDLPATAVGSMVDYFKSQVAAGKNQKLVQQIPETLKKLQSDTLERADIHELIYTFWRTDKNFKAFAERATADAYQKSSLSFVNEKLKRQENSQGFYYKLDRVSGYLYAFLMLPTESVPEVSREEVLNTDVDPELRQYDRADVRMDHFTEAVIANLKMLFYTRY